MQITTDELKYHTIEKVNTYKVRSRFPRLVGKNAFRDEHAFGDEFVVKELITDKGASGWGLGCGLFYKQDPVNDQVVLGRKLDDLIDVKSGIRNPDLFQFDFALHDLAGIVLDLPVYKMFGNLGINPVPCYDTLIYFDDSSPDRRPGGIKAILDNCKWGYDYGYRAFKLKIGRAPMWMNWDEGIRRDIEVTRLVRQNFPDCEILVDANDAYTVQLMLEYVKAVADVGLYWIEEPFRESVADFQILREYLDQVSPRTLIADGETNPDIDLLLDLNKKGLLGVFQMDISGDKTLGHSYGLTPWRKIMLKINSINGKISPHAWGLKIKTHYAASFCAGYPGVSYVEGITDITEGVDFESYTLSEGYLKVPDKPGFGMDLIWGMPITNGECESKSIYRQV
jgi:L-alanine-DL-glutamate epimerase-like enolase superfamily enzyme